MEAVCFSEPRCQISAHCSVILAATANLLMSNIYATKSNITNTVTFNVIVVIYIIYGVSQPYSQGPTCRTESECRVLRTPILQLYTYAWTPMRIIISISLSNDIVNKWTIICQLTPFKNESFIIRKVTAPLGRLGITVTTSSHTYIYRSTIF
jgi:hypothetical protein